MRYFYPCSMENHVMCLLAFSVSLLDLSQVVMFFNSLFKLMRFSGFFPPKRKQASSAYNTVNSSSETLK